MKKSDRDALAAAGAITGGIGLLALAFGTKTGRSAMGSIADGMIEAEQARQRNSSELRVAEAKADIQTRIINAELALVKAKNPMSDSFDPFKSSELRGEIEVLKRALSEID